MSRVTRRSAGSLLAAAGLLLAAGTASAEENYASVRLSVPVKLNSMLPEVRSATVTCEIRDEKGIQLGRKSQLVGVVGGKADTVTEFSVVPLPGKTFATAKTYYCYLAINRFDVNDSAYPLVGTPPKADLFRWARPDAYFLQHFQGPLDDRMADAHGNDTRPQNPERHAAIA